MASKVIIVRQAKPSGDTFSCCSSSDDEDTAKEDEGVLERTVTSTNSEEMLTRNSGILRSADEDRAGGNVQPQRWSISSGEGSQKTGDSGKGQKLIGGRMVQVNGDDMGMWQRTNRSRGSLSGQQTPTKEGEAASALDISASLFAMADTANKSDSYNFSSQAARGDKTGQEGDGVREGRFVVGGWRRDGKSILRENNPSNQQRPVSHSYDVWTNLGPPSSQKQDSATSQGPLRCQGYTGSSNNAEGVASLTNAGRTQEHDITLTRQPPTYQQALREKRLAVNPSSSQMRASPFAEQFTDISSVSSTYNLTSTATNATSASSVACTRPAIDSLLRSSDRNLPVLSLVAREGEASGSETPASNSRPGSRAGEDSGQKAARRGVVLTRYSSPQDVLQRISSRQGSADRQDSTKGSKDGEEGVMGDRKTNGGWNDSAREVDRLMQQLSSKDHIIEGLHKELRRLQKDNDHLQGQLRESDSFIEQKVSELARRNEDSRQQLHNSLEENRHLRKEVDAHCTTITGLREKVVRLEGSAARLEREKNELTQRLRVAGEVAAAHQRWTSPAPPNSSQGPLHHENNLLRQQLGRQEREITTLRREVGPAKLLTEARGRANAPTASDRLSTLLVNMEDSSSVPASSDELSQHHDAVMRRANAALSRFNLAAAPNSSSTEAPESSVVAAGRRQLQLEQHRAHAMEPSVRQLPPRRQPSASPDVKERRAPPPRSRSPGVARLLEKYRGMQRRAPDGPEPDGLPHADPAVTVYSLGRKIHDAERGRTPTKEDGDPRRVRAMSADRLESRLDTAMFGGRIIPELDDGRLDEDMGLWADPDPEDLAPVELPRPLSTGPFSPRIH